MYAVERQDDVISAPSANAVDAALQSSQRGIDRLYLSITRMSQSLKDLIHFGFNRVVLPALVGQLFQMILDPVKPTFQLSKPPPKLLLLYINHVPLRIQPSRCNAANEYLVMDRLDIAIYRTNVICVMPSLPWVCS